MNIGQLIAYLEDCPLDTEVYIEECYSYGSELCVENILLLAHHIALYNNKLYIGAN